MVGVFYCLAVNRKRQWPLTKPKFNLQKQYVVPRETVCTLNLRIPSGPLVFRKIYFDFLLDIIKKRIIFE
jgi:hypothetical protein